ncbi:MAG: hypothetical protein AAGA63_02895, partial [Pseudomonadota bacterium]
MKMRKARRAVGWPLRVARALLAGVFLLCCTVVFAGVVLLTWLAFAPVNLTPVVNALAPQVNAALSDRTGQNISFSAGRVGVAFDALNRLLEIEVNELSLVNGTGGHADLGRIFFKVHPAVLSGQTAGPVILSDLKARVVHKDNGTIEINGFTGDDLSAFGRLVSGDPMDTPPPILITNVDAEIDDATTGLMLPLRAERIDIISLTSTTEVFGLVRVREGDFIGSRINTNLSLPRSGGDPLLQLDLAGLDLSRLDRSGLVPISPLDLTGEATGTVTLRFDELFNFRSLSGRISVENAGLSGEALPQDLNVLFAEGGITYTVDDRRILIEEAVATGDIWTASLDATAKLTLNPEGEITGFTGTANRITGTLNAPKYFPAAHQFRGTDVPIVLQFDPLTFVVQRTNMQLDGTRLAIEGSSGVEEGLFVHRYRAASDPRFVREVLDFWPKEVVPNTRAWAYRALQDATLTNLDAAISARGSDVTLRMSFDYSGLNAFVIKEFPPVSHASGSVQLTEKDFRVSVDAGTVYLPKDNGGIHGVDVAGSTFYVPDITQKPAMGEAIVRPIATLDAVEVILDHPPFEFLTKSEITTPQASALVTGELGLQIPLKEVIKTQDVVVDAVFGIADFRSTDLLAGKLITGKSLTGKTDGKTLEIEGLISLEGHPADVQFTQELSVSGGAEVVVNTELTQDLAAVFDVPVDDIQIEGAASMEVLVLLEKNTPITFAADASLRGARLSIPQIRWAKSADADGALSAQGQIANGVPGRVEFDLSAPGLTATGAFLKGRTEIAEAKVGRWFTGGATLVDGEPPRVRGETIDLRFLPPGLSSGGSEELVISSDRLILADGLFLTDISGQILPRRVDRFTGRLNGRVPVDISISREREGPVYTITGRSAGRALEELGIIDDVRDGEFLVKVQDRGDELVGRFTLEDIRVRTASPIVSLLDAISLVGLLQQLNGPGLRFDKVTGNFRMIEEGIEIDDVSAVGASLGFTTAGVYVPSENRVDLEGTVTPIYALNGLFERVFKKPFGR